MDIKKGDVINGYEINNILGRGSFGQVYIGIKNNETFVLKFIKIEQKDNQSNILSIVTEIAALNKITDYNKQCKNASNNSSLCLIDTFINFKNNSFCIVTNFLSNSKELRSILNNRKKYNLDIENIMFIFYRLISQLNQLHMHNIVHSDIKPENIIVQTVSKNIENILFIDYGVSCVDNCYPNGTIAYMAPELLPIVNLNKNRLQELNDEISKNEISKSNKIFNDFNEIYKIPFTKDEYKKTDVFSLGVTLYELINCKYPYPYKLDYIIKKIDKELDQDKDDDKDDDQDEDDDQDYYKEYPKDVIRNIELYPLSNYYKQHKSLNKSTYNNDEHKDASLFLNNIVDMMLILDPKKRPSIHEIKELYDEYKSKIYDLTYRHNLSP